MSNILFILPCRGFGGTEIHSLGLAEYFISQGHKVTFVFPDCLENSRITLGCSEAGIRRVYAPVDIDGARAECDFEQQKKISQEVLEQESSDLVLVAAPSPLNALGVLAAINEASRYAMAIFHYARSTFAVQKSVKGYFQNSIVSSKIQLICISQYVLDNVARAFDVPKSRFTVIANGVNIDKSREDYSRFLYEFGLEGKKILFTPGRYHQQKAVDILVEAIPKIVIENPDVHFLLCGDGPLKEQLAERAKELGVSRYVSFAGFFKNSYNVCPHVDITLLPTRDEGLALRLLEAFSMGAVIATSDAAYQDQIISHGVNGYIFESESADSLAETVNYALSDSDNHANVKAAAIETAKQYSFNGMLNKYKQCLNDLLLRSKNESETSGLTIVPHVSIELASLEFQSANGISLGCEGELKSVLAGDHDIEVSILLRGGKLAGAKVSSADLIGYEDSSLRLLTLLAKKPYEFSSYLIKKIAEKIEAKWELEEIPPWYFSEFLEPELRRVGIRSPLFDKVIRLRKSFFGNRERLIRFASVLEVVESTGRSEYLQAIIELESRGHITEVELQHLTASYRTTGGIVNRVSLAQSEKHKKSVIVFSSHYCFPPKNGSDRRVTEVIRGYANLGFKVVLCCFHRDTTTDMQTTIGLNEAYGAEVSIFRPEPKSKNIYTVAFSRIKAGSIRFDEFYDPALLSHFYDLCATWQPNVVYINYAVYGWLSLAVKNPSAKKILDLHDLLTKRVSTFAMLKRKFGEIKSTEDVDIDALEDSLKRVNEFRFLPEEIELYQNFDRILAISAAEQALLQGAVKPELVTLMSYVPAYLPFNGNETTASSQIRAVFLGSNNVLNIIAASILESISVKLSSLYPEFQLHVYGDVSKAMKEAGNSTLHGFVNCVDSVYQDADFALCPILYGTGQNIKITEALSKGVPVIAFQEAGLSAGVISGVNGILVTSISSFYDEIAELVRNPSRLATLKESCRKWAKNFFNTEYTLKILDEVSCD
ncbi:glycosyltransferase [Microbulbifer mangrovi]|uniref:glycosyltransferase n=1 Tax=Microbulbifer mangrovi TaxID=927787 RepID=UPI00099073AF|nr:glycosyltransferase [Microbulbifer mangrovi]